MRIATDGRYAYNKTKFLMVINLSSADVMYIVQHVLYIIYDINHGQATNLYLETVL